MDDLPDVLCALVHSFNDGTKVLEELHRWIMCLVEIDDDWWEVDSIEGEYVTIRRRVAEKGEDDFLVERVIFWGDFIPRDAAEYTDYFHLEWCHSRPSQWERLDQVRIFGTGRCLTDLRFSSLMGKPPYDLPDPRGPPLFERPAEELTRLLRMVTTEWNVIRMQLFVRTVLSHHGI